MGKKSGRRARAALSYIALAALTLFVVVPILWIVSTSIKPSTEIFAIPPRWLPEHPTLAHYDTVLKDSSVPRYVLNSLAVGALATALSLLLGGAAGYGFARHRFRGNRPLSLFMLFSQMLPLTVLMIPVYFVMARLHLLDSLIGVAIAHLILTLPLVTWMSRSFFATIPKELEEAAQIDGCSPLGALFRVALPVVAPGIAATAIYAFIMSWNEFVLASILTNSDASRTLPVGLTEFAGMFDVNWGATMAASFLTSLPVIGFFLWLQKYFVQGLGQGAVKG